MNENHQILSLEFAFIEIENTDTWYWFLRRVNLLDVRDILVYWPEPARKVPHSLESAR
jgi:hypothetical protein